MSQRAVIFDMDGVLIDSYHAHHHSWQVVGEREGIEVTEAAFAETFGRTSREAVPMLWPADGLTEQRITEIDEAKEAAFREILSAEWPEMAGVRELIVELRNAGWPLAVASSGPLENVAITVRHFEDVLRDQVGGQVFSAVITAQDVVRGKPEPEVFLKAAERLGVAAAECVVIEDAVPGVQAANAAGMRCVVVKSTGHAEEEYGGLEFDRMVEHLDELDLEGLKALFAE